MAGSAGQKESFSYTEMKKVILLTAALCLFGVSAMSAQGKQQAGSKVWEEAQARKVVPEIRTFVTPQICDMQMLATSREVFGPYYFEIKSIEQIFNFELTNYQNRALYRALQESDADAIIEPLFNSYVYDKDEKKLIVEVSGFPIKYVNFRPASKNEVDMIGVIYPDARTSVSVNTDAAANPAPALNTKSK